MASRAPSLALGKKRKINYEVPVWVRVRTPMNAKASAVRHCEGLLGCFDSAGHLSCTSIIISEKKI